jgi:hypothetical protein
MPTSSSAQVSLELPNYLAVRALSLLPLKSFNFLIFIRKLSPIIITRDFRFRFQAA